MKAKRAVQCLAMSILAGLASGIGQHLSEPQPRWSWREAGGARATTYSPAEAVLALTPTGMPVVAYQGDIMNDDNTCQVKKVFNGAWRGVGGATANCRAISLAADGSGSLLLLYNDTAAGCPSVKRWTAAEGWRKIGSTCSALPGWSGASAVAPTLDGSAVAAHPITYRDRDRPTERFSLSFSIIKQYGQQQTTETLFPNWDFVISSSIAVLPAGDDWPEVAVVLGSGQRVRNPPDRSNMDGIYLLAYSLATGKTWKQRVVAGRGPFKEPALFSLTQSGPRLVVAVKASTTSVAYLWRIERGRFPTFKATLLPPASPLPPSPPSTYGSDGLAVAAGNDGVVYLASSNDKRDAISVLKLQSGRWQQVGAPPRTGGTLHLAGLAVAPHSSQPYVAAINEPRNNPAGDGLRVWQFGPAA